MGEAPNKPFEPLYVLHDQPVEGLEEDHLGMRSMAHMVAGAAMGTPGPFTIGVYSGRGMRNTNLTLYG